MRERRLELGRGGGAEGIWWRLRRSPLAGFAAAAAAAI